MRILSEVQFETCPPEGIIEHEYAKAFPMLDDAARQSLIEDVRANGVLEPIVFIGRYILDGRNRYYAARECGIAYPRVEYLGDDPLAFVVSRNLHRRHLSESQRAMVAANLAKMPRGGDRRSDSFDQTANLRNDQAAGMLNVSPRTVETARKVVNDGAPELIAAVEAGHVSVSAAAEVASLPSAEQTEIVALGDEEIVRKAKEIKERKRQEREAKKAETERQQQEYVAQFPPEVQAMRAAAEERRAQAKASPAATDADEVDELRAALAAAEQENAELRATIAKFDDMVAEYERGGFENIIEGLNERIRVLQRQVERESQEKVKNLRSADYWKKKAIAAGANDDVVVDMATGEITRG